MNIRALKLGPWKIGTRENHETRTHEWPGMRTRKIANQSKKHRSEIFIFDSKMSYVTSKKVDYSTKFKIRC